MGTYLFYIIPKNSSKGKFLQFPLFKAKRVFAVSSSGSFWVVTLTFMSHPTQPLVVTDRLRRTVIFANWVLFLKAYCLVTVFI